MTYNTANNNRPSRRTKKDINFEPSEKLAQVWAELHGYGVYTVDRQGVVHEWAQSRKQCNIKLNEVKKKFDLKGLNITRFALLGVEGDMYSGRLFNEALPPVLLKKEIQRVQLIRTLLLTSDDTDRGVLLSYLEEQDMNTLRTMRGIVRDEIWSEDRKRLYNRIQAAVFKGKAKGKIKTVRSKMSKPKSKGNHKSNNFMVNV